jgi:TolA-binding protein
MKRPLVLTGMVVLFFLVAAAVFTLLLVAGSFGESKEVKEKPSTGTRSDRSKGHRLTEAEKNEIDAIERETQSRIDEIDAMQRKMDARIKDKLKEINKELERLQKEKEEGLRESKDTLPPGSKSSSAYSSGVGGK